VIGTSPIDGAEISVSLETADGNGLIGETTVEGGNWMVEFPEALAAGEYTISVTQGIDGVTSAAATSTFTITPENAGNGGGSDDEQPAEPTPAPSPGDNDGGLAPTGATQSETVLPLAGGAALLMAAGAALLFVRRKTRA
jgi:LPXTG-motif cell wall-anchored protein